jgi:hypothetical protein
MGPKIQITTSGFPIFSLEISSETQWLLTVALTSDLRTTSAAPFKPGTSFFPIKNHP